MQITIALSLFVGLAAAQTLNIPTRVGTKVVLSAASAISGIRDFGNREFDLGQGCALDVEYSAKSVFILEDGATLSNVIIGIGQKQGVHCKGACTLKNIWFRGRVSRFLVLEISGGGAKNSQESLIGHKGVGTVTIKDYTIVKVNQLYKSCSGCANNGGPRNVIVSNLRANTVEGDLVGINSNFGDVAMISGSCGANIKEICQEYKGVSRGQQPAKVTTTKNCRGLQANLAALPTCN